MHNETIRSWSSLTTLHHWLPHAMLPLNRTHYLWASRPWNPNTINHALFWISRKHKKALDKRASTLIYYILQPTGKSCSDVIFGLFVRRMMLDNGVVCVYGQLHSWRYIGIQSVSSVSVGFTPSLAYWQECCQKTKVCILILVGTVVRSVSAP